MVKQLVYGVVPKKLVALKVTYCVKIAANLHIVATGVDGMDTKMISIILMANVYVATVMMIIVFMIISHNKIVCMMIVFP